MSGHLLQYLRGGKTTVIGDTLEVTADHLTATGTITGTTVSDASGALQNRRYVYQFAAVDISAAGATVVGPIIPAAAVLERVYYVVTEATAAQAATAAIQIGVVDADGSSNGDVDKYVLGTAAASGLIVGAKAVGTCVDLTIAISALPAGKAITATHISQAVAGTVVPIIEYSITG